MQESLKTLFVILLLAMPVFAIASRPACEKATARADFVRRRNLWIAITATIFLANNFWLYIGIAAALLAYARRRERNPLALYFFVLFAVPLLPKEIGGFGGIQSLFSIDYGRLLALVVLLPAFINLRKEGGRASFGHLAGDKMILAYIAVQFLLILQDGSTTHALRLGIFYTFLGIFLPYFVASRSLRTLEAFREAMMAYVVAAMVLSLVALFEFVKHWLLYKQVEQLLGVDWGLGKHLVRSGSLRAIGSTGQPIALGFAITVGIGFMLYLRPIVSNRLVWQLGMGLLLAGLMASISRGPWVGAVVVLIVFFATGASPVKQFLKVGVIGTVLLLLLLVSPMSEKVIKVLPWVGSVEQDTIDYRSLLLQKAILMVMKNPLLGARNFLAESTEMQELALGSGFIDVVNTYIRVALTYGLMGLSLFVGCFAAVIVGVINTMRRIHDKKDESYRLGQSLLSVLVSIALMISTVSSISVIPWIYWSVIGMGGGYVLMMRLPRPHEKLGLPDEGRASREARES
jgi:O-antigen ligase